MTFTLFTDKDPLTRNNLTSFFLETKLGVSTKFLEFFVVFVSCAISVLKDL